MSMEKRKFIMFNWLIKRKVKKFEAEFKELYDAKLSIKNHLDKLRRQREFWYGYQLAINKFKENNVLDDKDYVKFSGESAGNVNKITKNIEEMQASLKDNDLEVNL